MMTNKQNKKYEITSESELKPYIHNALKKIVNIETKVLAMGLDYESRMHAAGMSLQQSKESALEMEQWMRKRYVIEKIDLSIDPDLLLKGSLSKIV